MNELPITTPADDDRRAADKDWKASVDEILREGSEKFAELAEGQATMLQKLAENTSTTEAIRTQLNTHMANTASISKKMDDHVKRYDEFSEQMRPVVAAVDTMQGGVRILGKFGEFCVVFGKWFRRAVIWLTPIAAAFVAAWHYLRDGKL